METKQTAVQWLVEQMLNRGYFDCNKPLTFTNLDHLQHQALQMEREQIIDAYNSARNDHHQMYFADEYFNKTYGGHSVDDNEMIDHIADVSKMVGGQDE